MSKKEHYLWIKREVGKVIFTEIFGIKSENQRITTLYKKNQIDPLQLIFHSKRDKKKSGWYQNRLNFRKKKRKEKISLSYLKWKNWADHLCVYWRLFSEPANCASSVLPVWKHTVWYPWIFFFLFGRAVSAVTWLNSWLSLVESLLYQAAMMAGWLSMG